jgi:hypothetical protein
MTINAGNQRDTFSMALEIFSSMYGDMDPSDLPPGLSPDNRDCWYIPGKVQTRPALNKLLTSPPVAEDVVSLTEYSNPNGDYNWIWLYANGAYYQRSALTETVTQLGSVTEGSQFRSITAFDKQFFAFFNQGSFDGGFANSPYVGYDVPRYWDGKNIWRVTQDAPAITPTVIDYQQSLAITDIQIQGIGAPIAASPTGATETGNVVTIKTTTAHGLIPNQSVFIEGVGVSGYNGLQTIQTVPSPTTFTYLSNSLSLAASGGGSAVTPNAFIEATGTGNDFLNIGDNIIITGTGSGLDNGISNTLTGTVDTDPTGTIVSLVSGSPFPAALAGAQITINGVVVTVNVVMSSTSLSLIGPTTASLSGAAYTASIVNPPTWPVISMSNQPPAGGHWRIFFDFSSAPAEITFTETHTGNVFLGGQSTAGPHKIVCMFASVNGAITAPSVQIPFESVGNTQWVITNLPIGPPGTAQRILAFTPAYGSSYFYLGPSVIPATIFTPEVLNQGTIVNDNTSITAQFSIADEELTSGINIGIQGNNLFQQIVLSPCLGCIEYLSRLGWWGEINDIKNFLNNHFDGGYAPPSGVVNTSGSTVSWISGNQFISSFANAVMYISGVPYTIGPTVTSSTSLSLTTSAGSQSNVPFYVLYPDSSPPGWNSLGTVNLVPQSDQSLGFAAQLVSSGSQSSISQPCYQDNLGGLIIQPNIPYTFRCLANYIPGNGTSGLLSVLINSGTLGNIAFGSLAFNNFPSDGWIDISLPSIPVIPQDAIFTIGFLSDATGGGPASITIDEIEMIDANQPVLYNQMRISYFQNAFGYDDITGILDYEGPEKLTAAFIQRSYLYALTDGPMHQTQNNGTTEPNGWGFPSVNDECDCYGPNAVTSTEDVAWWAGQSGFRVFSGASPKKLSQEMQPTWETIANINPPGIWVCNDPEERLVYIGLKVIVEDEPANIILPMSYRAVDSAYNVPDPLHISYSGKLITSDLCRKWTIWNTPMPCGAILHNLAADVLEGSTGQMFFGGEEFGNLYSLNFNKFTDDDYGQISSYYTTYFFFNHEIEQNSPQLGLHQKMYTYLTAYITGVGTMQPQLLMNNLNNPWGTYPTVWDPVNIKWMQSGSLTNPLAAVPLTNGVLKNDLEWGLNINSAARLAVRYAPQPLAGQTDAAFVLTHCVLSARSEKIAPVRGSNQ